LAKQSGRLSGTFVVGGIGIIGTSITYLQPPALYLGWGIGLFLSVGCPLGIFYWNQRQRMKSEEELEGLSEDEVDDILDDPPTLKDFGLRFSNGYLFKQFQISFTIKNNRSILLDEMESSIEVTDIERNRKWTKDFPITALGPRESQDQVSKMRIGLRLAKEYKVIFLIYRMGIEVYRSHFQAQRQFLGDFRISKKG